VATSLSPTVFGRQFQNPILLAAGTAAFGREVAGVVSLERLGGLVTKAVSTEPRAGNRAPRVAEFSVGMLNSVGLANPGLIQVRERELPWLADHLGPARLLVNVVGSTAEDFANVVAGLDLFDCITAFELNLSCPNTHAGGLEFGADPRAVARVVELAGRVTHRPLVAKLSPVLPDIAAMAVVARDSGAVGVTVVNTLPGYLADAQGRPRLGHGSGGVSGPALLPIGLQAVRRIRERAPDLTVIGVGGVRSAADARQYLQAGASLVAIGTAGLADPRLPQRVAAELALDD
jgi:dihydroorotate dehydrogenase (NAD+) catalytic subunit